MTSDINLQVTASQRLASSTTKVQEAVVFESSAKSNLKTEVEKTASTEEMQELSIEQLNEAVEHLNALAQNARRELSFSIDDDTGRTVITVKDMETDKLIRQIPSEQVLSLISRLENSEGGLLQEMV